MLSMNELTDDELAELASLGDSAAFHELWCRSGERVRRLVEERQGELPKAQERIANRLHVAGKL